MKPINVLSDLLVQIESEANHRDQQYGEHHQPLFDQTLFHCQSKRLLPYTEEAKQTFAMLEAQLKIKPYSSSKVQYLSDKLICQLDALKKELSSFQVRQRDTTGKGSKRNSLDTLYQDLAQHQKWEQQLKAMVSQSEQEYSQTTGNDKALAFQKLEATQRRLQRCQQAKLRIEKHLTYKERNQ